MASSWKSLSLNEKIRRGHTLLWWALVFPCVVIAFLYTSVTTVWRAQAILNDHSIAQAVVAVDTETPVTKQLARFKYSFEVDGKTYSRNFPVPWARADDIEIGGTIPVAHANFNRNLSQREVMLAINADMTSNLKSAATLSALGALLIGLFSLLFNHVIQRRLMLFFD